ncbi:unnamed protein product [Allacma fusca]|uniref:Uncharacterized protein n=1 Tax=Allacma fusca TaxID=39272 RepID=A0A8J2L501_9HEXA|nr:unnamed protein product [Allacma fusca]
MQRLLILSAILGLAWGSQICDKCVISGKKFSVNLSNNAFCSDHDTSAPGFTRFTVTSMSGCIIIFPLIQKLQINSVLVLGSEKTKPELTPTSTDTPVIHIKRNASATSYSTKAPAIVTISNVSTTSYSTKAPAILTISNVSASSYSTKAPAILTISNVSASSYSTKAPVILTISNEIAPTHSTKAPVFLTTSNEIASTLLTKASVILPTHNFSATAYPTSKTSVQLIVNHVATIMESINVSKFESNQDNVKISDIGVKEDKEVTHQLVKNKFVMSTHQMDKLSEKESKLWRALYRVYTLTGELEKMSRATQAMKEYRMKNPFAFFPNPKKKIIQTNDRNSLATSCLFVATTGQVTMNCSFTCCVECVTSCLNQGISILLAVALIVLIGYKLLGYWFCRFISHWRRHRQRTQPSVALNLENPNYQGAEDNIYERFPGFVEMEPMETNIPLTPEGSPRRLPSPPGSISFSVYSTPSHLQ